MLSYHRRTRRRTDHAIRQCLQADSRHHPAPAPGAGKSGRRQVLRRAGAGAEGFHAHRQRRPRHDQHPGGGQADAEPAALRDLPAVDAVGTVRGTARGRRSAETQAGVLLRRGASVVQRCAEGADGQDRAGGAADPLEGRRRLLRDAEPDRRAGQGARHSWATACSTRCAPSPRATRRRSRRQRRRSGPIRSSIPRRSSRNSARARRWCRSSKATARRRWSSASWSGRRRRGSGRSRRRNARRSWTRAR